jgi:glycosyltransferase involved in cell wall biosynthesis
VKKRVCLIRQSTYPYDLLVLREAETLNRAGLDTHVISLGAKPKNGYANGEKLNGVHVHRIPLRRRKTSTARYLYDYLAFLVAAALKVTRLHLRHPFSAIQVTTMPDFLVFATIIPKLLGSRVVIVMNEPTPELWQTLRNSPPPRILNWLEQAAIAYADAAFTVTQQLKEVYVSRGADAEKIKVIPVVPEGRFLKAESGAQGPTTGENFTLICHGAIEQRYGHDTMLEAVAVLRSQIPNLRLRILGSGTYLNRFLARKHELGIDEYVEYLGFVPLSQLIQELQAADVGIVAQESSPYSNLVLTGKMFDYIHFQKPVLASRLKAIEAYFDDSSIRFFEPGDAESLADGVMDLYRHPNKRQELVVNSQRLYDQYRWEVQGQIYLSVYDRLLE